MSALSKVVLSALLRSLRRVSPFVVLFGPSVDDHGSSVIFRSVSVRPKHLFDQNFDHDYYFKLPLARERDAQSNGRCSSRLRKKASRELVFVFWLSESLFFFSLFLYSGALLGPQRCGAAHFLTRYDGLGSLRRQVSDSHQVVDCCGECEHPAHSLPPPVPRLPHQPDGLQPPEHFLDSFAFSLADLVARMPCRALIDCAPAVAVVLRYVRRHAQIAHIGHELLHVVSFVASHRHTPSTLPFFDHLQRRLALRRSRRFRHPRPDHQPVAILRQHVPQITQLRLAPRALLVQPRLGVRRRFMRRLAPLLPVKIHRRIPRIVPRNLVLRVLVLRAKTLLSRPGLNQRPVHREVLVRQQLLRPRLPHHLLEKSFRDLAFQ